MSHPEAPKGKIIQIVIGTRIDHVPAPKTQEYFSYQCMECQLETMTEIEYPEGSSVVCNVCASVVSERLAKEYDAPKVLDMLPEAKARLIDEAKRLNVPVETLIQGFLTWKTGSPVTGDPPAQETQQMDQKKDEQHERTKRMSKYLNENVRPKMRSELEDIDWPNTTSKQALVHFEQQADTGKMRVAFGGGVDELLNLLVSAMAMDERVADFLTTAVQMYHDEIAKGRDLQSEINSKELTEEEFYSD